jgi:hypothetical protein
MCTQNGDRHRGRVLPICRDPAAEGGFSEPSLPVGDTECQSGPLNHVPPVPESREDPGTSSRARTSVASSGLESRDSPGAHPAARWRPGIVAILAVLLPCLAASIALMRGARVGAGDASVAGNSSPPRVSTSRTSGNVQGDPGISALGDLLEPRVSSVFVPPPGEVEGLTASMMPEYDKTQLSDLLHFLHLRGRAAVPTTKIDGQPVDFVEILLDSAKSESVFGGSKTLYRTLRGARFGLHNVQRVGTNQRGTEAHPGQALAVLGALGIPLDRQVRLGPKGEGVLGWVLDDLKSNFLLQGEIYWDAIALALYVPPARTWENKYGDRFTFDALTEELLSRPQTDSACAGTHRLISLTVIFLADERTAVLSEPTRRKLRSHLAEVARMLVDRQHPDGSWGMDWHEPRSADPGAAAHGSDLRWRVVPTGHHLEWLMLLPDGMRPPDPVFGRAAAWLLSALVGETKKDGNWLKQNYCPATHAIRSVRILAVPRTVSRTSGAEARHETDLELHDVRPGNG